MSPSATVPIVHDLATSGNAPESDQTEAIGSSPNLFSLKNQTVAVTGGGRGLGITLAIAIVEAGGHVACLDILPEPSPSEWKQLQTLAKKSGVTATYDRCDITNEDEVSSLFASISSRATSASAPFSGLIACAGIQQTTPVVDYPIADFQRMLNVNVTGTFICAKHASRLFIENSIKGSIVLIASMSGSIANRGLACTAYNTSKSAVLQMARSMAQEVGQHGIRVNTLSPGYIRTAMTDALLEKEPEVEKTWLAGALLGRLGAPEDFKAPAVFLLASGSSFMTGADLRVDGGHCAAA
jgi:NAD(P)-dependent dehydrogenase (short-subunit alcohol dehydrogenase family)